MLLDWSHDLSVENETIDKEHQHWINILNEFYQGLLDAKPKEKLEKLLVAMLDYTKFHFANEEKYMVSIGYPDIEEHKEKHRFYVEKLTEYYTKLSEGKLILSLEVTGFLKTWLVNHIKGVDQQYARYAKLQDDK